MPWLIKRVSPHEPISYWGVAQRWIARRRALRFAQLLNPVPDGAMRFYDYDSAFDIAQVLRAREKLAYGESIAVNFEPEPAL